MWGTDVWLSGSGTGATTYWDGVETEPSRLDGDEARGEGRLPDWSRSPDHIHRSGSGVGRRLGCALLRLPAFDRVTQSMRRPPCGAVPCRAWAGGRGVSVSAAAKTTTIRGLCGGGNGPKTKETQQQGKFKIALVLVHHPTERCSTQLLGQGAVSFRGQNGVDFVGCCFCGGDVARGWPAAQRWPQRGVTN